MGDLIELDDKPAKRERAKKVGPRLVKAIEALASGEHKTIKDAAAFAGLTREALSKALGKRHVQAFMQGRIQEILRVGAVRAGQRMVELLASSNEMVGFNASRFVLATGAGVMPPTTPAVVVNNNVGVGYVIDLREPGERDRGALPPVLDGGSVGYVIGRGRPEPPVVVIEGEASAVPGEVVRLQSPPR